MRPGDGSKEDWQSNKGRWHKEGGSWETAELQEEIADNWKEREGEKNMKASLASSGPQC